MTIKIDNRPILILDIDETLIHSVFNGNEHTINYRPYLIEFLKGVYNHFNLFIFTAATKSYALLIIRQISIKMGFNPFKGLLHRDHITEESDGVNTFYYKDLIVFFREFFDGDDTRINNTIIVDNIKHNYHKQPNNGINIKDFIDDPNDTCLEQLYTFLLQYIASKEHAVTYLKNNGRAMINFTNNEKDQYNKEQLLSGYNQEQLLSGY